MNKQILMQQQFLMKGQILTKVQTPDGKSHTDEATITGAASTTVEEATQEPFTQSVKEGQAPQEPPAQRVGESLIEAESGMFLTYLHSISRIIC